MTTTPNQTTFREAMVDAAHARGGAGAEFIARGESNLWLDIAMDAFAALQSPTDREGDGLLRETVAFYDSLDRSHDAGEAELLDRLSAHLSRSTPEGGG